MLPSKLTGISVNKPAERLPIQKLLQQARALFREVLLEVCFFGFGQVCLCNRNLFGFLVGAEQNGRRKATGTHDTNSTLSNVVVASGLLDTRGDE